MTSLVHLLAPAPLPFRFVEARCSTAAAVAAAAAAIIGRDEVRGFFNWGGLLPCGISLQFLIRELSARRGTNRRSGSAHLVFLYYIYTHF